MITTHAIKANTIFKVLLLSISILLIMQIISLISISLGHDYLMGFIPLFAFDLEQSVPTFFSFSILFVSSLLLFFIALSENSDKKYWFGLSMIFLFLSMDESISIHEKFVEPTQHLLNTSGYMLFAWVIPYTLFVIIFLLFYFKFLLRLPRKIMIMLVISGAIYVFGAIGLELFEGKIFETDGRSIKYLMFTTVEETMEMLGVSYFIYSLVYYLSSKKETSSIKITFSS